jgi:hypothetical protein
MPTIEARNNKIYSFSALYKVANWRTFWSMQGVVQVYVVHRFVKICIELG